MSNSNEEVCVDIDVLTWALERVGGGPDGCDFEPTNASDPDHHGPEFAAALFEAIQVELAEYAVIKKSVR